MATSGVSEAARALAHARWGNQRAKTLAHKLTERIDELPDAERQALRAALEHEPRDDHLLGGAA